jgi:hypothetical protein
MRTFAYASLLAVAGLLCPLASEANEYLGATVSEVSGYTNFHPCVLFLLTGVTQADPVVPNNGWFAISASAAGAQSAFATLLAAKLSGTAVHVLTDGTTSCGFATASWVSSN